MKTVTYNVPAMHCGHCVHTVKMELSELEGVQSVDADFASKKVVVKFSDPASDEKIKEVLSEINYPAVE